MKRKKENGRVAQRREPFSLYSLSLVIVIYSPNYTVLLAIYLPWKSSIIQRVLTIETHIVHVVADGGGY